MPGTNVLGDVRPGAVALWAHPTRTTRSGARMPVLAVGEPGDGRTIALGLDGAWELEFSRIGSRTAGRGHGALWDGLLGWLMRDPRFEPAQLEIVGGCTAGLPGTLRARLLATPPDTKAQTVSVELTRIDRAQAPIRLEQSRLADATTVEMTLPPLEAGGYTARLRVGAAGWPGCQAGGVPGEVAVVA